MSRTKENWVMVMGRVQGSGNDWGHYYSYSEDYHGKEKALELAREYIRQHMIEWPNIECMIDRRRW
jgi:hypothetical protein